MNTFIVERRGSDFAVIDTTDGSLVSSSSSCGRARAECDRENAATDIGVRDEGTIVLFAPRSLAGEAWLDEAIPHAERFGPWYVAEHRFAGDIIEGATGDGLLVAA